MASLSSMPAIPAISACRRARTVIQLDCGQVPEGDFALDAHAGFLAFELSSGAGRLVVNCGAGGDDHAGWDAALRATAAHSTLTLADTSSAQILPPGLARDLLGPRLTGGPLEPPAAAGKPPRAGRSRPAMTPMCRGSAWSMSARSPCRPRA